MWLAPPATTKQKTTYPQIVKGWLRQPLTKKIKKNNQLSKLKE